MIRTGFLLSLPLVLCQACAGGAAGDDTRGESPWGDPEPTVWEAVAVSDVAGETAGEAVLAWMSEKDLHQGLGMEFNRLEIEQDTPELARVLMDGLRDDSIQGQEFEVRLEESDGEWKPVEIRRRWICRRGVSENELCL